MRHLLHHSPITLLSLCLGIAVGSPALGVDWKFKSGEGLKELEKRNWQEAVLALTEANEGLRADMAAHGSADSLAAKKLLQYLGVAHLKLAQECLGTQRLLAADSHAATAVEIFLTIPWVPKGDLSLAFSTYGVAKDSLSAREESLELHRKSLSFIEEKAGQYDPIRALYSLRTAESYVALGRLYEAEPLYMAVGEITDSAFADKGQSLGKSRFGETLIPPTKKIPKWTDWLRELRVGSHIGLASILKTMHRPTEADSVLSQSVAEMVKWKKAYCVGLMDKELGQSTDDSTTNSPSTAIGVARERWNELKMKSGAAGIQ